MTDHSPSLSWDVHVAASEPLPSEDLAPGQEDRYWSPISATLISGERDALPVDALLTAGQATDLTEWVAAHGKNLTSVYITHGHGDHWFGLGAVLDRFDLESSLRQTAFVFAGRITTAAALIDGPRREASRLTGNPELLR